MITKVSKYKQKITQKKLVEWNCNNYQLQQKDFFFVNFFSVQVFFVGFIFFKSHIFCVSCVFSVHIFSVTSSIYNIFFFVKYLHFAITQQIFLRYTFYGNRRVFFFACYNFAIFFESLKKFWNFSIQVYITIFF